MSRVREKWLAVVGRPPSSSWLAVVTCVGGGLGGAWGCADLIGADFDAKTHYPEYFGGAGGESGNTGGAAAGGTGGDNGGGSGGGTGGADTGGTGGGAPLCEEFASGVVINEVRGQGGADYIELYNAGTVAVDLTGWSLSDGSKASDIEGGLIIQPGDWIYFQEVDAAICQVDPCPRFDFGISAGGGETVFLRDADDVIIDQLAYPSENGAEGLNNGETLGRLPDGCENTRFLNPTPDTANERSLIR